MNQLQFDYFSRRGVRIGARWDDASQNSRFIKAKLNGLLDYAEVNFPVSPAEDPLVLGLAILAHTSNNPLCSVHGLDLAIASRVKAGADLTDSPWIGEHLAWLGFEPSGALGYVINPMFTTDFAEVACGNIRSLREYYGRPIALELGPLYNFSGDYANELEFLSDVARRTDSRIILDLTHWIITNKNLKRPSDYGLSDLATERLIEIHVAGMRKGHTSNHWHDAHGLPPSEEIFASTKQILRLCSSIEAITLEHAIEGSEQDFYSSLQKLKELVE
jgi:uncharacterized protein